MNHQKVHQVVESICNLGCTVVNEKIENLENGEDISETEALAEDERDQLLKELKAIMDVYEKGD